VRSLDATGFVVPPGWYGRVPAAGVGIVRRAGLDVEEGLDALERLAAPDPESRTPDFDGRRLVRVDGGYIVLNFMKYRDRDTTAAERQQRYRDRQKGSNAVTSKSNAVTERNVAQRHAVVSSKKEVVSSKQEASVFDAIWDAYPKRAGGNPKATALKAYNARLREGVEPSELLAGVQRYAGFVAATGKLGTEYVKQASTFFGPDRHWEEPWDIPATAGDRRANAVTSMLEGWANGE